MDSLSNLNVATPVTRERAGRVISLILTNHPTLLSVGFTGVAMHERVDVGQTGIGGQVVATRVRVNTDGAKHCFLAGYP